MKAAVLNKLGTPLEVKEIPDAVAGTGEVLVEVIAAPVLSYASEVFSGERKYLLELPIVPGCGAIGRVKSTGPDATHLKMGDWVFCDPTVRSRDNAINPDITLQGWSARGEGGMLLQKYYHDGPFAQQVRVPTENAISIGSIDAADASKWCALTTLLVPYGGLLAGNVKAGDTVLISGGTGNFGSAAVTVAMAMGAGRVIVPGRNKKVLEKLSALFGSRIKTLVLTGDYAKDTENMKIAGSGTIDCVFDILPPSAEISAAKAAILSVRPYGRVVLMGGVGMLGGEDLALPYPWIMRNNITIYGQWMLNPEAVTQMANLVNSGLIDLENFGVTEFKLDDINEAVAHASEKSEPFNITVVRP